MYVQSDVYFNKILSKQQYGFRKGFSAQHCLLAMTEKWQKYLDKDEVYAALLKDLSKVFDCLLHDLSIAKFAVYCFDYESLTLMQSYLSNRQQTIKLTALF